MSAPRCRACGIPLLHTLIDLGDQPLANSYLTANELAAGAERRYPLHARVCQACFLVQVEDVLPAEAIFAADYAYFSSYSASWVAHAKRYAQAMIERLDLGPDSLVAEVASNDGYLLRHFVEHDIPVLGIEPAAATVEAARARGVRTEVMFFNEETATRLAARGVHADLIAANNVLAHVPDINGFVAGFRHVLKPEGVLTFEFPHLLNLIGEAQFDTIYHEHFSYLSLLALEPILARGGLRAFDVEQLPTHGGSLRLYCVHWASGREETPALGGLRAREHAANLDRIEAYGDFAPRCEAIREAFRAFLAEANASGATVGAYGAAAKGNTFLNWCGATARDIAAAFDANPAKQHRYLPGSHVPVRPPAELASLRPDYLVLLPWNLKAELMDQLGYIRDWGGRFVVATPGLEVIA